MRRRRYGPKPLPANYTRFRLLALAQTPEQRAKIMRDFPLQPVKVKRGE